MRTVNNTSITRTSSLCLLSPVYNSMSACTHRAAVLFPPDLWNKNCKDLYDEGHKDSGVYTIDPRDGGNTFNVFCDMTLEPESAPGDRGWLVIQRRVSGSVDFNRSRDDYKYGFGQLDANMWLGLEKIRRIIESRSAGEDYELYIGMGDHETPQKEDYAKWKSFSIGSEASKWTLSITTADLNEGPDFTSSSNIKNSLAVANQQPFTTKDDAAVNDCAITHGGGGGWWYKNCHETNPNGYYYPTHDNSAGGDYTGIVYEGNLGEGYSLKTIVLAIRPKSA